jgi:LmbE family N-acetylglucosaminyl deacetylase
MIEAAPVLVIAAHPDDEVLGCGGTIARWAREGHAVFIAILGEGITSRPRRREETEPGLVAALQAQCRRAAQLLGAREVYFRDFPDNRLDTVPLLEVIKSVEELLDSLQPSIVNTHHGGDLNVDHRVVHQAVLTATRPLKDHPVREVYAFEVPSSTEWAFQRFEPVFRPNVFVDISDTLPVKLEALAQYDTERRAFPHPRSPEAVTALARRWGSVVGCEAAEAFELIRAIR